MEEKERFSCELKRFARSLGNRIASDGAWTIRGFIDIFKNVYALSTDTKLISKVLELHLFPHFLSFAEKAGYRLELASFQNWYPDLTFIQKKNEQIKFAVDLKTTYRDPSYPEFCNGFTLGSHGEYFVNRESGKNIQYPYSQYAGHFCLGIIYSRTARDSMEETNVYSIENVAAIPPMIRDFTFFAQEKWRIASDKGGSGNTANIGSIQKIDDIVAGNGVFCKAGEAVFDDYWANFGVLRILTPEGNYKKLSSLPEFLNYRGLPPELYNPRAKKKKGSAS